MFSSEVSQIFRFGLVGVWNTGFDLAIYFGLFRLLRPVYGEKRGKLQLETLCHAGSFLVANTVSYQLNSRFTFQTQTRSSEQFFIYVIVSLLSLTLSSAIINFLAQEKFFKKTREFWSLKTKRSLARGQYAILIKIVAVVCVMVVNYLGYRYLVFGG